MLRSFAPRFAGVLAAAGLTLILVPTALAKEGVEASLAAPIPADAQPGDTVEVFFSLTAWNDQGTAPMRGAPAFFRLIGPTGAVTQADGVEQRTPGTYKATIVIPAGGAAAATFGIHGSKTDADGRTAASDLVWPYDGVLVAARPPAPVDPGDFRLPQVTTPEVVVAKDATEAVPPIEPAPASTTGPALDPRAIGGVALAALVAVTAAAAVRRRFVHPATA